MQIAPDYTEFVTLSFEGRDPYSCAGGLGLRMKDLSTGLASMGFPLHLFFVGDPWRESGESFCSRRLLQSANSP